MSLTTSPAPAQAISGSVTANQGAAGSAWPVNLQLAGTAADGNSGNKSAGTLRVVLATDQPQLANALKVDGSAVTQPVSGTVTANVGTTGGLALDASVAGLQVAQASTTSGQSGPLAQGAVTAAAPSYATAKTSPLSLTAAGSLRVDGSGATQPVSGTVTASQGGAPWSVAGAAASGSAKSGNPQQVGHVFNTAQPTVASGQVVEAQATARGGLIVATGADAFNVTVNAALPAGSATLGAVTQASGPWAVNHTQWNGTAADTNSGPKSAGTLRVVLATDQPQLANRLLVTPDSVALPAHQGVNLDQWNGVAPAAAALLADGAALPTAPSLGAAGLAYNGSALDLRRGNTVGTVLLPAARTAGLNSAAQTNHNARGVHIVLNVSAASGTGGLTVLLRGLDPVTLGGYNLTFAPAAVTATGTYAYELYPGASSAATGAGTNNLVQRTAGALPRIWFVVVTAGDASSYTYSIGYSLIL